TSPGRRGWNRSAASLSGSGTACLDRMDGTEDDRDAVPGVDRADQERQLDLLPGREVPAELLIILVGSMGLGHQRQGLGPGERGPLAVAVERRFAPGAQEIQPLLGLAVGAGVLGVHVD